MASWIFRCRWAYFLHVLLRAAGSLIDSNRNHTDPSFCALFRIAEHFIRPTTRILLSVIPNMYASRSHRLLLILNTYCTLKVFGISHIHSRRLSRSYTIRPLRAYLLLHIAVLSGLFYIFCPNLLIFIRRSYFILDVVEMRGSPHAYRYSLALGISS